MKRCLVFTIAVLLCLALVAAAGCGTEKTAMPAGPKDQSKTVNIEPGERFTVELESVPSTGYQWSLAKPIDTSLVKVDSTRFEQATKNASETAHNFFVFETTGVGTTTIPLEYIRPWERNQPAKSYVITVNIRGKDQDGVKQYSDPNVPITAAVRQEFLLALPANPTTGFTWQLAKPLDPNLMLAETSYTPEEGRIVGAGGTQYWRFEGISPGTATITLNYARSWEKGVAPAKTETFTVNIQ